MKIEVLMGDVGHHRHVEIDAVDAALRQSVRGRFQHNVCQPRLDHARQVHLDLVRGRRGHVQTGRQFLVSDHGADGRDQAGTEARRLQNAVQ